MRDEKTIRKHINNVFAEEEVERESNTQKMSVDGAKQSVLFYCFKTPKALACISGLRYAKVSYYKGTAKTIKWYNKSVKE